MKQTIVHLNNLKKAMELSKTNTVVFENCTNFEKYSSDKYNSILNLCVQNNFILNELVPHLKAVSKIKTFNDEEKAMYYYKPLILAYDYYGSTDYWWIVLAVNGFFLAQDFTGWDSLIMPERSDMESILDKQMYSGTELGNI